MFVRHSKPCGELTQDRAGLVANLEEVRAFTASATSREDFSPGRGAGWFHIECDVRAVTDGRVSMIPH